MEETKEDARKQLQVLIAEQAPPQLIGRPPNEEELEAQKNFKENVKNLLKQIPEEDGLAYKGIMRKLKEEHIASSEKPEKKRKSPITKVAKNSAETEYASNKMHMLGAIVGDIAGSWYEHNNCKSYDIVKSELFRNSRVTDDSILTLATAELFSLDDSDESSSILNNDDVYTSLYQKWGKRYKGAGYGGNFRKWIKSHNPQPYQSWGNGSAMRVSPIGWVAKDIDWAMEEADRSAKVTHNHPEGIKGAQAVAVAVFMARSGKTKIEIKETISMRFGYNLDRKIEHIRPTYAFEVSCQESVPEAIIAFLESTDFTDAIILAISLGGDSDTIASIAGAIAHAYYGSIPLWMVDICRNKLDPNQLKTLDEFCERHAVTLKSEG